MTAPPAPHATTSWSATASLSSPGWTQVSHPRVPDADLLTLELDHDQAPIPVRLHVQAGRSRPVATWIEAGYQVSSCAAAELGPGVQCVAQQDMQVTGGQIVAVCAQFVFTAGEESVVVAVAPTLRELFGLAFTGLHELLGTLQVRRPDGSPFRALPVPGYTLGTADTWAVLAAGRQTDVHAEERSTDGDHH
ncbi:MAG TPA: hypothetical protein VK060_02900 [Ruania sp.]|nr:hypothetical protein [Ruania sp.]